MLSAYAGRIRPIVLCVFSDGGRILVAEAHDSRKDQTFYRPIGGTIEFGERAADALRRELREEINAEITGLRYLGTLENIFTYEGRSGHEIVLVYDARFVDGSLYEKEEMQGWEVDIDRPFRIVWKHLDEFSPGNPPLYPEGLLDLLAKPQKAK